MAGSEARNDIEPVLRPIVAIALWSYAAWYAMALLALALGLPDFISPVAAVLMGGWVTYDWRRPRVRRGLQVRSSNAEKQPQHSG